MELDALEVLNATPQDLLVRSVADNEVRLNLDRNGRIRVAKKLHDAGVQVERHRPPLGVSVKTYERDLLIAPRLDVPARHRRQRRPHPGLRAPGQGRGGGSPPGTQGEPRRLDRPGKAQDPREGEALKAQQNKELRPADRLVRHCLSNHLVAHWLDLLGKKRRFDEDAHWNFAAGIEEETDRLRISSVSLDLAKAPLDQLALVASKLSRLTKQLRPYIQKRHDEERRARGDGAADSPYDLDYLRELGLDDFAQNLEERLREESAADGEEDPDRDRTEERTERDAASDVQLPAAESQQPGNPPPASDEEGAE